MADFATIVRPFQAVDVSYPRRIVKTGDAPPDNVVLTIGDNGGLKTLAYSRSYSMTTYMKQKRKEQKKDTKRHVMRIIGKEKGPDGEPVDVPDAWIDVERDDEITWKEGGNLNYQETVGKYEWYVDEEGKEKNPVRKTNLLKVIPSDADPDDPYLWFDLDVNDVILSNDAGQEIFRKFDNTKDNAKRRKDPNQIRRIVHSDTPYDGKPQYAAGGIIKDYEKTPDTKDEDQYLDIEIIGNYEFTDWRADPHVLPVFEHSQVTEVERDVDYLIEDSQPTDKTYGDDEIGPPWRFDPLQRIVNVQVKSLQQVLLALPTTFGSDTTTLSTKEGSSYSDKFGDGYGGASGLGKTVIGNGYNFPAFGKPRDGASCFIRVNGDWWIGEDDDNTIRRGVLNDSGELVWTTVGSFPSVRNGSGGPRKGAYSCCFAGGAFFITYEADVGGGFKEPQIAVSFDGLHFKTGIRPFRDVNSASITGNDGGTNVTGGNVVFNKKKNLYVTTGSFDRWYDIHYVIHIDLPDTPDVEVDTTGADENFMSSVSSDGINWTPHFDLSQGFGLNNSLSPATDIGARTGGASTVCFCDELGIFLAPTIYKNQSFNLINAEDGDIDFPFFVHVAGVATSTDGVHWTNKQIGPPARFDYADGGEIIFGSRALAITFVKTGDDNASKGYFLLAVTSFGSSVVSLLDIYLSENGSGWSISKSGPNTRFVQAMTQINKSADPDTVIHV